MNRLDIIRVVVVGVVLVPNRPRKLLPPLDGPRNHDLEDITAAVVQFRSRRRNERRGRDIPFQFLGTPMLDGLEEDPAIREWEVTSTVVVVVHPTLVQELLHVDVGRLPVGFLTNLSLSFIKVPFSAMSK